MAVSGALIGWRLYQFLFVPFWAVSWVMAALPEPLLVRVWGMLGAVTVLVLEFGASRTEFRRRAVGYPVPVEARLLLVGVMLGLAIAITIVQQGTWQDAWHYCGLTVGLSLARPYDGLFHWFPPFRPR